MVRASAGGAISYAATTAVQSFMQASGLVAAGAFLALTVGFLARRARGRSPVRDSPTPTEAPLRSVAGHDGTLGLLVDGVQDYGIFLLDVEGRVMSWNAGAERMTGYAAAEIVGRHFSTFYPPEVVAEAWPRHELQLAAREGRFEDEGWRVRRDGTRFWANAVITALRDADGRLIGFGKVTRDLTERRHAEEELRSAAGRLHAIVETAVDGIITINDRGTIQTVNPATERLFGYSAAEMIGHNVNLLMPEPYHAEHDSYLHRYRRTGTRRIIGIGREVRGRRKDGSEFPIDLAVSETQLPGRRFFTGIIRDISERKAADEALRRSEDRLAGIINSAMDAIITVDQQQRIVVFNAAAEAAFRCAAADAIGRPLEQFIPARYRRDHAKHIEAFGRTGVTSRTMWRPGTLMAVRSDGEEFPIEATISQVESEGQRFYTVILRDITERVRVEERLQEALDSERLLRADAEAANRAKDQFLATVSHELRTPLNAIIGYADLIVAGVSGPVTTAQETYLRRIGASSKHLLDLIEQVLTFARNQAITLDPQAERFDVGALISDTAALLEQEAQRKGIAYDVDVCVDGAVAATDPAMLRQVLLNLLSNAIKFTDHGSVALRAGTDGTHVTCSVTDTGTGIRDEDLERIFEPFWQADATLTRRVGGTGLGLSVVRRLVEALGGEIAVESTHGHGSTFRFRVPLRISGTTP